MANIDSYHDKFFKATMSRENVAKEFLLTQLPEKIKSLVDMTTLKSESISFVDEKFKKREADLLYSINFGKKLGYVYILFEHLSNPDKMIAFRLLKYMINIMDRHMLNNKTKVLPVVYPLIVYTGGKKYSHSTDLFDLFGEDKDLAKNVLFNPYNFFDISKLSDDELKKQIHIALMAKAMLMKEKKGDKIAQVLIPYFQLLENFDSDFAVIVVRYLYMVKSMDENKFMDEIMKKSSTMGGKTMTVAEKLLQEGRKQSAQQIARSMLAEGLPIEIISKTTGLAKDLLEKISKDK